MTVNGYISYAVVLNYTSVFQDYSNNGSLLSTLRAYYF